MASCAQRVRMLSKRRSRSRHDRSQRAVAVLEALLVLVREAIEVALEQLIERRAFGVISTATGIAHAKIAIVK